MDASVEHDGRQDRNLHADPLLLFSGFPQIRQMILTSLSMSDLLNSSQVSRMWRRTVSIWLSSKNHTAYIRGTCKDIRKLNRQLKLTKWTLINALSIQIPREHAKCYKVMPDVDALCCNLNKLQIRSLDIYVSSCKATQQLARQLVLGAKSTLQELTLTYDNEHGADAILSKSQVTFPKLEFIDIHPWLNCWPQDMFDFVRAAPNLKAVRGACWLHQAKEFNCTRLDVFTRMIIMPFEHYDDAFISLVTAEPKLTVLHIADADDRIVPSTWSPNLIQLLRQSQFTLQRLSICAVEFLSLQRDQFVLQMLDFLELFLPEDSTIEDFHNIVCRLNLQTFCPDVKSMKITLGEGYCIHDMQPRLSEHFSPSAPIYSVQELITGNPQCPVSVVEACTVSFPMLLSFGFEMIACAEICEDTSIEHFFRVHKIWIEIPTLEELKICLVKPRSSPEPHSLDALLCGLSVDEISSIKESFGTSRARLHNLKLCPIRPSVMYAPNLKRISLVVSPNYRPKALCMPDVSVPLVFSRKLTLRLQITSHCSRITDELQSLATVAEVRTATEHCDWW